MFFVLPFSRKTVLTVFKGLYQFTNVLPNWSSSNFRKIHRKTPVLESLFNKVACLQVCNFFQNRFQHRCFPVIFAKSLKHHFYRTPPSGCICTLLNRRIPLTNDDNYRYHQFSHVANIQFTDQKLFFVEISKKMKNDVTFKIQLSMRLNGANSNLISHLTDQQWVGVHFPELFLVSEFTLTLNLFQSNVPPLMEPNHFDLNCNPAGIYLLKVNIFHTLFQCFYC